VTEQQPYRWFDHTADVGMEVEGATIDILFENAARGLYALAGAPPVQGRRVEDEMKLRGADLEELLVSWLNELLYRLTTRGRCYDQMNVAVKDGALRAHLSGGVLPEGSPRVTREVKAVTYHDLQVSETPQGWRARLVFDV
jgi:SHS2 domain-containing protein